MASRIHTSAAITFGTLIGLSGGAMADHHTMSVETQALKQWHNAILSGYTSLADKSEALAQAAAGFCAQPDPDDRAVAEQAWLEGFLAWQKVRFVDFGPVESSNLAWQFQFWPDPKNLVGSKARFLLNSDDPITAEQIDQSGVAVQGFPMAEYLLFDTQFNNTPGALANGKGCDLLVAVTNRIQVNSKMLAQDWATFRTHYVTTPQYKDTTVRAGMAGLEILEERRLAQPMGIRGSGKRSVYAADAWRSGSSLMAAEASVSGLNNYFMPGFVTLLEASDEPELARRITDQFNETLGNFPALREPMATLVETDDAFARLQSFYVDVSQLANLVNSQAAVTLGVARGFNSSDGD